MKRPLISLFFVTLTGAICASNTLATDQHQGHNHDGTHATHAHDAKPLYGGVVTEVKDINYELVAKADSLTLYIIDHGKPLDVKGASATLALLSAAGKTDVVLQPVADRLEAKGTFKLGAGTKVLAQITLPGKPAQAVRFTLK
jgi:hypothetical protein